MRSKKKLQNKHRFQKKVEIPEKVIEASKVEEPVKEAEPNNVKEPVKVEEPTIVAESNKVEDPVKEAERNNVEEPVKVQKSNIVAEPNKEEEPVKVAEPIKDVPVIEAEPIKKAEPIKLEEAVKVQEPSKVPEPIKIPVKTPTDFAKVIDETQNSAKATEEISNPARIAKEAPIEVPEVIKHPLQNTWGFWLYTNEKKNEWVANQKELTSFDTVEDYWCLYHHMKLPTELKLGQDYAIFKQGISPMWEDTANKVGGRWLINIDRKGPDTDRIWLDVVLLMIGDNFKNSDLICGAVVNIKQKNRVSIWTRNKEEAANMEIGRKLKEMLRIHCKIQFLDHKTNGVIYYL